MRTSIVFCVASLVALVWILRNERFSLGLPVAYLASLLLIHVPGAVAHAVDTSGTLTPPLLTRTGIILTALGSVAFVAGVWLAHAGRADPTARAAARSHFWRYCVLAGGIFTVIGHLVNIPSIGAVLSRGGAVWMLGVLLGLAAAMRRGDNAAAARWIVILAVYPVLMLMLGGFLSYGSMAVIIVLSALAITARSALRVAVVSVVLLVAGMSVFLSYFEHRPEIRAAVWGGASADARIDATLAALRDVRAFDPGDASHLNALDQRLNQNYFVGLAARRIEAGHVDYLYGRSVWEGVQALVPRALWPDKPVVAGSPKVVSEMTGLTLDPNTSFGVGNVMEFHINFGAAGVAIGFLLLGLTLGWLDRKAAEANATGSLGQTFIYFLPAVALIQPNGSIVEMMSGAAAALAAAYGWRWAWDRWPKPVPSRPRPIPASPQPLTS